MAISTAVDLSAVARVVGIKTEFKDLRGGNILYLPQRVAVVGQGNSLAVFSTVKRQFTSAAAVGAAYGPGSPLHQAALQLLPVNGDGVGTIPVTFYPLEDDGDGVAALGDITPAGTQTRAGAYRVKAGGVLSEEFVIITGDTVAAIVAKMVTAINAVVAMPVSAANGTTKVNLTAKWAGETGNGITATITGPVDAGTTFAISQLSGGLVNPDVSGALAQIGNVWETMLLNCLNIADTVNLDRFQTFGEGRWGALVRKPLVVFTGNTETDVIDALVVSNSRKTDRVNAQLVAPGSPDSAVTIAARQLARIVKVANNNPARDYGSQDATGLTPGLDGEQWNYPQRDQAVKGGSSTIEVKDGVVNISDVVTFYHPTDEAIPAYRYVVDIVKLQTILFNLDLAFATKDWDGAPLIPDNQPTTNREAKKPKMAVTQAAAIVDNLALNAILSDPEVSKANIEAGISSQNPKRLDLKIPVQLSGNANIISIDLDFGFFFGTDRVVN